MSERLGPRLEAAPQPPGELLKYLVLQIDRPDQPGYFQATHEYPMGMLSLIAYSNLVTGERTVLLKAYGRQDDVGKLIEYRRESGKMVEITYASASSSGSELRAQVGDDKEPPANPLRDAQLVTTLFGSFMAEQAEMVGAA